MVSLSEIVGLSLLIDSIFESSTAICAATCALFFINAISTKTDEIFKIIAEMRKGNFMIYLFANFFLL